MIGIHTHSLIDTVIPYDIVRSHDHNLRWDQISPTKGAYNWTAMDAWYDYYGVQRGKQLLVTLYGTPTASSSRPTEMLSPYNVPGGAAPPSVAGFSHFVDVIRKMAARYPLVKYWEVGNEPKVPYSNPTNTQTFHSGTDSILKLAQMTRLAKQIIPGIIPSAKILNAPPSTIEDNGIEMLKGILNASAKGYDAFGGQDGTGTRLGDWVDIYAVHGYVWDNHVMNADIDRQITSAKAAIAGLGFAGKPLWITEVGLLTANTFTSAERVAKATMSIVPALMSGADAVFFYSIDHAKMGLSQVEQQQVADNIIAATGADEMVFNGNQVEFKRKLATVGY